MTKKYILLLLLFIPISSYFATIPGSSLWFSGFDAGITSQGFAGTASKNSAFFSFSNPATIATIDNFRVYSSGSIELPYFSGLLGIASPISPGGRLYGAAQYLDYDKTILARIGYGKMVRSDLAFGMEGIINVHTPVNNVGGGLSFGTLWIPKDFIPFEYGWGIKNFSFGSKIKFVFFPTSGAQNNYVPEIIIQNGIEATFMEFQNIRWKFVADFAIGAVPLSNPGTSHLILWGSLGTTFTFWNVWDISIGTILGNFNMGFGDNPILPFTVGTSVGYDWETFSFKLIYNLGAHQFFEFTELRHTVGLELGFGETKNKSIQAILSIEGNQNFTNYFSPNNDLIQDTITLLPKVIETNNINAWRITIQDMNGRVVKTFEGENNKIDNEYYIGNFFRAYFVPNKLDLIPEKIIWDGKNNNGKIVNEGTYAALLHLRYNETEIVTSKTNTIIVDNTPPEANITTSVKTLYLGDNPKDRLLFYQDLEPNLAWRVEFIDQSDESTLASWFWKADEAPLTNSWELKNPIRMNVSSGLYSYIVSSYDKAGNFTKKIISNIGIETKSKKPKITSDLEYFSPNHDDEFDFIKIFPDDIGRIGVKASKIVIYDSAGNIIKSQNLDPNDLPSLIIWDGKNSNNKKMNDGSYVFIVENQYDDDSVEHSNPLIIHLDNSPPNFTLNYTPKRFSPDKDSVNDTLTINFNANDVSGIGNWKISIEDQDQKILKEFEGSTSSKRLDWIPPKNLLQTGDIITIKLTITDILKNQVSYPLADIKVDVLLDNYEKNLIIMTNTVYFDEGKGILAGDIFEYLDKIAEAVKDYPSDRITIQTGSYYSEAMNSEYESYRLGVLRSEAVKAYLVKKGIPENNIFINIKAIDEKNKNKQKELRRIKIFLDKDYKTLKE